MRNAVVTWLFALASACVLFFSAQLAIYCLSAFVNLVHVGKPRGLRQNVVLGSGIFGTAVPPLLGNRIRKGIQLQHDAPHAVLILSGGQGPGEDIQLQHDAPHAVLILSGGQGPGEDIPEGRAMMAWALEHGADPSRTIVLILSGGQGPGEDIPEGRAMMAWALEHGADPSRTIAEERSRNTEEKLAY